jgi:hypothetical protein
MRDSQITLRINDEIEKEKRDRFLRFLDLEFSQLPLSKWGSKPFTILRLSPLRKVFFPKNIILTYI